jgi:signal transduction histidine kinase
MLNRLKQNLIATIGLGCCSVLSVIGCVMMWVEGPQASDLRRPLGTVVVYIASQFTSPASMNSAGTARDELTFWMYFPLYALVLLLFTLFFWLRTSTSVRRTWVLDYALLAAQLIIGITVEPRMLFLFSAELALAVPFATGLKWLGVEILLHFVTTILIAISLQFSDSGINVVLLQLTMDAIFYLLAYGVAYVAVLERRTRYELAASHAELQATQSLLGDTVRISERMRIARDLHDSVGHHLTALNLHLDLALRQSEGKINPALQTSRELSSSLLAEVRMVVSTERNDQHVDLRRALETLCSGIPAPEIRLMFEDRLEINSAALAHTLFCCVQEAVSNALRHACAAHISIEIKRRADTVLVSISDDGKGTQGRPEGNGLLGMRERLEQIGGMLKAGNREAQGFALEISVPYPGGVQ